MHRSTQNRMKRIISVVLLALTTTLAVHAVEKEKTIFDSEGEAVAYIALDDELNIFQWKGDPVAFLKKDAGGKRGQVISLSVDIRVKGLKPDPLVRL